MSFVKFTLAQYISGVSEPEKIIDGFSANFFFTEKIRGLNFLVKKKYDFHVVRLVLLLDLGTVFQLVFLLVFCISTLPLILCRQVAITYHTCSERSKRVGPNSSS
jgi:hypothetical protein